MANTLPDVGKWEIDPVHSSVNFSIRHLVAAKVRGRFNTFSGFFEIKDPIESSTVEVEIDAASIDTGTGQRDDHLRSADFFDVEHFPKVIFKASELKLTGDSEGQLKGEVTVHDVTIPITLDVEFLGTEKHIADGSLRAGFSAITEIDREDLGVTYNAVLETGGLMIGKKAKIEIDIEAVKV